LNIFCVEVDGHQASFFLLTANGMIVSSSVRSVIAFVILLYSYLWL